tara:strand:- start:1674 stop:2063 length:390 start_codon:yes stop_codon:yes gene_type:complete
MKTLLSLFLVLCFFSSVAQAQSEDTKMREFLISCTYGTLVGAMVGAASIAFEDEPSEKLQNIARGASLGLYSGIALGVYVTNFYGKQSPEEEISPEMEPIPGVDVFYIEPLFHNKKLDGLKANLTLLNF